MEEEIQRLSQGLVDKLSKYPSDKPLLVGIAGIPASGKSTFALRLTDHINHLLGYTHSTSVPSGTVNPPPGTIVPPLGKATLINQDGWHLTRAQLSSMPDPALAHARRGAHWTFDALGYVNFMQSLRRRPVTNSDPPSSENNPPNSTEDFIEIPYPTFSHAEKDPVPSQTPIILSLSSVRSPTSSTLPQIIIIEGLYTLLSIPPWDSASSLLDERWFISVSEEEAEKRLVKRHVETGIVQNEDEARARAVGNDLPNGRFIIENTHHPTRIIESRDDPLVTSPPSPC